VTTGSDMAQLAPWSSRSRIAWGKRPTNGWWTGLPGHGQLDAVAGKTEVYAPVPRARPPKGRDGDEPPAPGSEFAPKPGDSLAVAQWRQRMNTDLARTIYKDRAATAECVNAQAATGLAAHAGARTGQVRCVVRLYALAHNLMRMAVLAPSDRLGHTCVRSRCKPA